jgi:hypothetical protein
MNRGYQLFLLLLKLDETAVRIWMVEWFPSVNLRTYIYGESLALQHNKQANLDNSIKRYLSKSACCYHYRSDSSIVRDIVPDIANLSRCDQGGTMGRSVFARQLFWRPAAKENLLTNACQEYMPVIHWHAAKGWTQDQG